MIGHDGGVDRPGEAAPDRRAELKTPGDGGHGRRTGASLATVRAPARCSAGGLLGSGRTEGTDAVGADHAESARSRCRGDRTPAQHDVAIADGSRYAGGRKARHPQHYRGETSARRRPPRWPAEARHTPNECAALALRARHLGRPTHALLRNSPRQPAEGGWARWLMTERGCSSSRTPRAHTAAKNKDQKCRGAGREGMAVCSSPRDGEVLRRPPWRAAHRTRSRAARARRRWDTV